MKKTWRNHEKTTQQNKTMKAKTFQDNDKILQNCDKNMTKT
jgi:hypothetical protein